MGRTEARTGRHWAGRTRLAAAALISTFVIAAFGSAVAAVDVRFDPGHVVVGAGQEFEVSFRVGDSPDSLASFQLYLSFDPSVIELTEAVEGSLYADSGLMTWFVAEEQEPGCWHFFDTVFGAGTHVLPPGELLHLSFTALEEGETEAGIDTVRVTDVRRNTLPVDGFENGLISVIPLTGVGEGVGGLRLGPAYPNPFVSTTVVPFSMPEVGGTAEVRIYDARGRLVRRIPAQSGELQGELLWDGRDELGGEVSSSVYFLQISAGES